MPGSDPTPRAGWIRRSTIDDGFAALATIVVFVVLFAAFQSALLANKDAAAWTDVQVADSAFLGHALPEHIPAGLTGLDSTIWVVYELRDERRRLAGNILTDSAIAHSICGEGCSREQVDSVRLGSYRDRAVMDLLARTELELELATRGPSLPISPSEVWRRVKGLGFGSSDILVLIVGGIVIALILRYVPERE